MKSPDNLFSFLSFDEISGFSLGSPLPNVGSCWFNDVAMPWSDYMAGKDVTSIFSTAAIVNRICLNSRDHSTFPLSYYSMAVFIKFVDTFNNLSLLIESPRWQNLSTISGFFISEWISSRIYINGGSLEWRWLQFKCSFFCITYKKLA